MRLSFGWRISRKISVGAKPVWMAMAFVKSRIRRSLLFENDQGRLERAFTPGMEVSNLSVIENGKSNPQLLTYAKIAAALNITLQELFDFDFDFQAFSEGPGEYAPRKHT